MSDDIDRSGNAATVRFGLDGDTYDVEMSATNEEELREFLSHYIPVGRRLSPSGRPLARRRVWAAPARNASG